MSAPPEVSIILPTYNRADTIGRAIDSVIAQRFQDWELIVVDDGSEDDTCDKVDGLDQRIRVLRQANAGVGAARNTGLAAARGRYVAFLDSDDAWLPHFLALTTAFLRAFPDEHWVTTEFDQDYGNGHTVRFNLDGVQAYAAFARAIGSASLALPPGETDDYLRVYETREPVGDWAAPALAIAGMPTAQLYRGHIFKHMRWGYLGWLPATVLTRQACDHAGPFVPHLRSAGDYGFLGRLASGYRANMIRVPSAIKYESGLGKTRLKQDHLATGSNRYRFELNKMTQFKALFAEAFDQDPELGQILRHYELYAGFAALRSGQRRAALPHLRAGARWQPHLRRGYALIALALLIPHDAWAAALLAGWLRGYDVVHRALIASHTTLSELSTKLAAMASGEA